MPKEISIDCLLVHVPKFQTFYPPLNVYQSCNRMAMGVLALAELADRTGYRTRVLHVGIERALDRRFSFAAYLRAHAPKVVGFSLQFHHGIVDTLRLVEEARRALPDTAIFLGGFTATYFSGEILEKTSAIDAIILGDGEQPFLKLLERVVKQENRDFSGIPNLAWRRNGQLTENEQSYCTDEETLNDMVYTRFDLLEHAHMYVDMPKAFIMTNLPAKLNLLFNRIVGADRSGIFWGLPVGRGCVGKCFYCGGGARAQWRISRRRGVIFTKPEKVIETIRGLKEFGFRGCYLSFDPHPWSQDYYVELFRLMREQQVEFNILFSAWGLPSRAFFEEFSRTAGPQSSVLISPETGSDRLRRKARGGGYTNAELLETLGHAEEFGVRTTVYFCIGVPGETEQDFEETVALKNRILTEFQHARAEAFLIEVEPGAPWHEKADEFEIDLKRRELGDFIRDHSAPEYSSMTSLGYTSAFFGDDDLDPDDFGRRLLKLRCRHFCDRRLTCALMRAFWFVSRCLGIAPRPKRQVKPPISPAPGAGCAGECPTSNIEF